MRKTVLTLALFLLTALPVYSVQPDEVLADPALETRAREISAGLRCLVCRNENIDDSNASLARDLRLLVRERLTKGDSDQQAVAYIVARYGEYVLLKPRFSGTNLLLWGAGPIMLIVAFGMALSMIRRQKTVADSGLDDAEAARLAEILEK